MVSRLDRLFILLDTGSNESIRLAAAKQLGEVQRVQPDDLDYLLRRIKEYSGKSVWETRVAAGHATRCVLEQVESWPPREQQHELGDDKSSCQRQLLAQRLIEQNVETNQVLQQFDIEQIMSQCPKLLSLDVIDTDDSELASPSNSKTSARGRRRKESTSRVGARKSDKEQLMRQRKLINKELGIAMVDSLNLGVKSTDIVSNDDLQTEYESGDSMARAVIKPDSLEQDNRAVFKTSFANYDKLIEILAKENCILKPEVQDEGKSSAQVDESGADPTVNKFSNEWPLTFIAKQYASDLFNPSWEIRHGAAIALREIVKLQGTSAGRRLDLTTRSNDLLNQLWLVDVALAALSVLALDKFGDFLFDQVVAPVRENAAQLLGCCVANMHEELACSTIKLSLKMLENSNWETRHGGILGLKYSLSVVDKSYTKKILQESFDPIFRCLGDLVDDVSAEAAASLVPVKDLMLETIPDKTPKLISFLWEHLANLDELTTSTSNIVLLLASLITSSSAQLDSGELQKSIPRLWSLLAHSSTSVRVSVLKALTTLIQAQQSNCSTWMPQDLFTTALRLILQRSILENMDEVRPHITVVWMLLIKVNEEDSAKAQVERLNLLKAASQYLNYWLCLVMQPSNSPIDRGSGMWLNIGTDGSKSDTRPDGEVYIGSMTFNADSIDLQRLQVTKCRLLGAKLLGALYANLVNEWTDSSEAQHFKDTLKYLADMFIHYIRTKSANQRIISGWTVECWASQQIEILCKEHQDKLNTILPETLISQLNQALQEVSLCYDELAPTFTRLQQETRDFVAALRQANISLGSNLPTLTDKRTIYNLTQVQSLCDLNLKDELTRMTSKRVNNSSEERKTNEEISKNDPYAALHSKQTNLIKSLKFTNLSQKTLSTSVRSSLACAHISWRLLPQRLKLIIDPLLDSIEIEEEALLQDKSIKYLVSLFDMLCKEPAQHRELIETILNRLIDVLSCKALSIVFELDDNTLNTKNTSKSLENAVKKDGVDIYKIVMLDNLQRKAELTRSATRRQSSVNSVSNLKRSHSLTSSVELNGETAANAQEDSKRLAPSTIDVSDIKLRGSRIALNKLAEHFAEDLPEKLPKLWTTITDDIKSHVEALCNQTSAKETTADKQTAIEIQLIKSLRLLEAVGESISKKMNKHLLALYADLILLLTSSNPLIRHHSSQCIGVITKLMFSDTIELINKDIIPMLDQIENTLARCGSIEAIALIIEHLQLELVPRIDMFIIHVLRRMSDQNDQVRLMATHCFGKLLSLMPLNLENNKESKSADGLEKPEKTKLIVTKPDERNFIEQLMNPKKLEHFVIPFKMSTELRSYQQDGLNWLAFLNRFNLHGILCDEMGLGKTYMTICMVASDHYKCIEEKATDSKPPSQQPSLIVCPSTLTGHWLYEFEKFLSPEILRMLNPVAYCGTMNDRMSLRCQILRTVHSSTDGSQTHQKPVNLVVASYDIVRNDIDFFRGVNWNYCVLDEGHIIKNGKTKLSRAIRFLNAKHRLILTGTPIQNNVTELWSLFDFLMPGFLGSERQFNSRYAKPILQSRELKCTGRELEAGALAMESLHRQVLPFILRRLKEDVLDDLPPKIIQDYFCNLSWLQLKLYEDFTRSKLCKDVTKKSVYKLNDDNNQETGGSTGNDRDAKAESKSHVFQALQYLKNVCNHPKLVLTEKHSQYQEIKKTLETEKSSLDDITHSSKLKALKQLLIDCGIGVAIQTGDEQQQQQQQSVTAVQSVVNQHRALIFCQIRSMVNIIENDLLKKHLPGITYLRLDGSVPANQRHLIVSRFNNDPSIDILLLTTQIGGLGLNLTGADTVIFVEHDWNPTKDLQAMDRAHRIGQKKVVNVYRLITKATLEEKIMGLQKFKTMVSNTVINQDNAGLGTMNVDQLFDLFEDTTTAANVSGSMATSDGRRRSGDTSSGKSSFMDLLPALWDQQQYETEYDLSNFVSSLKN